MEMKFITKNLI